MPTVPLYQANCSSCGQRPLTPQGCHHETEALTLASKNAIKAYYATALWPKIARLETEIAQIATCRMIDIYNDNVLRRQRDYQATMAEAQTLPFYTNYMNAGGKPHPRLCPPEYQQLLFEKINGARAKYHRKCNSDWVKVNRMLPALLAQAWEGVELVVPAEVVWGMPVVERGRGAIEAGRLGRRGSGGSSRRRDSLSGRMRRMSME